MCVKHNKNIKSPHFIVKLWKTELKLWKTTVENLKIRTFVLFSDVENLNCGIFVKFF